VARHVHPGTSLLKETIERVSAKKAPDHLSIRIHQRRLTGEGCKRLMFGLPPGRALAIWLMHFSGTKIQARRAETDPEPAAVIEFIQMTSLNLTPRRSA
jgi:hypothetical protein